MNRALQTEIVTLIETDLEKLVLIPVIRYSFVLEVRDSQLESFNFDVIGFYNLILLLGRVDILNDPRSTSMTTLMQRSMSKQKSSLL